jgi:peptide deformylase
MSINERWARYILVLFRRTHKRYKITNNKKIKKIREEMWYNDFSMPILPILTGAENPILRRKTKIVKKITKEIKELVRDMEKTMMRANGAGLAAPQIGRLERIALTTIDKKMTPLINPFILWKSEKIVSAEEGCLSLPDIWLDIPRSEEIILQYQTLDGETIERKLEAFNARVVQHEVDHLEGVLIVDYAQKKKV